MKKIVLFISAFLFVLNVNAKEITKNCTIKLDDNIISSKVTDNNELTYYLINKNKKIIINCEDNIKGLYLMYELKGGKGIITTDSENKSFGENGFLHDYINFDKTNNITLTFLEDATLTEIYVIGEGEIPSFVEMWEKPNDKIDLLLFSTHSDDDQLFFAGLLPYYVSKGANVEVVYFTNHSDNQKRFHELLHGLYTVGIRNYPVIGPIPDAWSKSLEKAISNLNEAKLTEDDALKFVVKVLRRFKPQVVVTHDENGEYGHGQHILCTDVVKKAIKVSDDKTYDIDSYKEYGIWTPKKIYIHLYSKNQITMNYDEPLKYFNGKTAFEMSQEAFKKHISQQNTWFKDWIYGEENEITKATQIETYSPLLYGLYQTSVGEDIQKNDMFENLSFYKDYITTEEKVIDKKTISTKQIILIVVVMISGSAILYLRKKL